MGLHSHGDVRPSDALDDVLTGRLGHQAIRQVALEPMRHGLADLLHDCLPGGEPGSLDLLRTKYKPCRKLTAYYQERGDHNATVARHLAVNWLAARPDGDRITVLVSPADPTMPQLSRLSQRDYLAARVSEMIGRDIDPRARLEIRTVRYRPGQRHVLHVRSSPGRRGVFLKIDRDDCGARAVLTAEALGPVLARRCPRAALAEPVGYSTDDQAALWYEDAGQPLWQRLSDRSTGAAKLVRLVGQALRVLHNTTPRLAAGHQGTLDWIGVHTVQAEAASTLRAGEHIQALLPSVGLEYRALVSDVAESLDHLPQAATFTHGDVKCDNILVHGDRIRILDLDRSRWADPALDLGKFLADLRWWCPRADLAGELAAAFRSGYGSCEPARWSRARLLAALFQLKLAARRCAVHDLGWASQVRVHVASAAAALAVERSA